MPRVSPPRHDSAGSMTPIEAHTLLTDQRSMALLDDRGRIVWLCAPRIDSPALCCQLLDGPRAGYFGVVPQGDTTKPSVRYLDDSFVAETRWARATLVDYFDVSGGRAGEPAGHSTLVRVIRGEGTMELTFAPRPNYADGLSRIVPTTDGLVVEYAGSNDIQIVVEAPRIIWTIERTDRGYIARSKIHAAEQHPPVVVKLHVYEGAPPNTMEAPSEIRLRQATLDYWSGWLSSLDLPDSHRQTVRRSALVLKALTYESSGAIAAAATTSLPEGIGGVRNWDYRYAWPRDAAFAAQTLARLGSCQEGMRLLDWIGDRVSASGSARDLRPVYRVDGSSVGPDIPLEHLEGYGGSKPVRIGNSAAEQVQLDVFGPILQLALVLRRRGMTLTTTQLRTVRLLAEAITEIWDESDHGIWEVRSAKQHYLYSKGMAWVGLRCAHDLFDEVRWSVAANEVQREIIQRGWNSDLRAFTVAYGSQDLDAAVLKLASSGLFDTESERLIQTVAAISDRLRHGPTVYRYEMDDGLPGREGGFMVCASWLVDALLHTGQIDAAGALLDDLVNLSGPTGMFAEQYDPIGGHALGNVPQAYSHLGIIDNVSNFDAAVNRLKT